MDDLTWINRGVDSELSSSRQNPRQDMYMTDSDAFTIKGAEVRVSKKSRNRFRLSDSISRVTSICVSVYAIFYVYTWHIVFAVQRRGACTARFVPLTLSSFVTRIRIHPLLWARSFASGRYCVTMYITAASSQTSTALRATDLGANVIIFRNLLSRCSSHCEAAIGAALSLESLFCRLVSDSRPTSRYFAFVQWNEFFFARESMKSWDLHVRVTRANIRDAQITRTVPQYRWQF